MRTGRSEDEFWRSTPRTLRIALAAFNEVVDYDRRTDAWLAWHVAALMRIQKGKLPTINDLLGVNAAPVVTGAEGIRASMALWRLRAEAEG